MESLAELLEDALGQPVDIEQIPERPGWKIRQTLYNLYHVLNHLNLFSTSDLPGTTRMIEELNDAVKEGV